MGQVFTAKSKKKWQSIKKGFLITLVCYIPVEAKQIQRESESECRIFPQFSFVGWKGSLLPCRINNYIKLDGESDSTIRTFAQKDKNKDEDKDKNNDNDNEKDKDNYQDTKTKTEKTQHLSYFWKTENVRIYQKDISNMIFSTGWQGQGI